MPTRLNTNYPRPTEPDEFESMVRDICAREWDDPHTEKFGRRGQKQNGIDVYGQPAGLRGTYRGAQCKLRTKGDQLTEEEIEAEVAEAKSFPHRLEMLIIVTDAPRDRDTQILIDRINEREVANDGFQVAIWFWDNVTERLAAYRQLVVKYYPEFFANLTTLPIAERLVDSPLQVVGIVHASAGAPAPLEEMLKLRGIRILSPDRPGKALASLDDVGPDGILCSWGGQVAEENRSGTLLKLASSLHSQLHSAEISCPAFAVLPAALSTRFVQTFESLGGDAQRIQLFPTELELRDIADRIFQDVSRYGHMRRGGLPTIDIAVRTRDGRPDSALLDMDWRSRLSISQFPSTEEWQEIFVPALAAAQGQVLNQSDRSRIQISCQLPLPAAFALGFRFNVRVARVGVWARKAGANDFKQQFWLSDADGAEIDFPVDWFKEPDDLSDEAAVVELTTYVSIHKAVARFIEESDLVPKAWVQSRLVKGGVPVDNIGEDVAVAYANHVGQLIRYLNEQGIVDIHLFARVPPPLAVLIGQRLHACGRIQLYWFNNPTYQFAFTLK